MKLPVRVLLGSAFALAAPLAAQTAPTSAQLVGTWVRTVDGKLWHDSLQGKTRQEYLTLRADSVYSTQVKTKVPALLSGFGFDHNGGQDSVTGKIDSIAGETETLWARWELLGDSLRFYVAGYPYWKYRVALQGPELVLTKARIADDTAHHRECTEIFTRFDPAKPLPAPNPRNGCQTVAGPLPKPPLPKAADLIGTWAAVQVWSTVGEDMCGGRNVFCKMTRYDTLTVDADGTMLQKVIEQTPTHPDGIASGTVVPNAQWKIAADTFWISWSTEPNQPLVKQSIRQVQLDGGGRYLLFNHVVYRRVTATP